MIIKINAPVGIYEIGARAKQEDALFPSLGELPQEQQVVVVCDGIGGHDYGEIASSVVSRALGAWVRDYVSDDSPMTYEKALEAVAFAQEQLNVASREHPSDKPMGTTLAMLVFGRNGVVAAHIGDSRIYHVRPSSGTILYRSRDHSLVNDLFLKGVLSRRETELSTKRSILTRAMLPSPQPAQTPDVAMITNVEPGDYFLVCSDGVCGEITDEQLLEVLMRNNSGDQMKLAAIQMLAKNGSDNRTAVLFQVDSVHHEEGETLLIDNEAAMCDKMVNYEQITPDIAPSVVASPLAKDQGESAATPPIPPIPGEVSAQEGEPLVVDGEQNSEKFAIKNKYKSVKWAGLIILTSLLLAGGIAACFFGGSSKDKSSKQVVATDTLADPDVSIDSLLPVMPGDSMQVGTDVSVPRAPGIGNVELPNTGNSGSTGGNDSKASLDGRYPTGSSVSVPRSPRYNGGNVPPYDPYENTENFGSDEPIHDDDPVDDDRSSVSSRRQNTPQPQANASTPPPPPSRPRASDDPAKSNRNVAVPLPSRRDKPIETP